MKSKNIYLIFNNTPTPCTIGVLIALFTLSICFGSPKDFISLLLLSSKRI